MIIVKYILKNKGKQKSYYPIIKNLIESGRDISNLKEKFNMDAMSDNIFKRVLG